MLFDKGVLWTSVIRRLFPYFVCSINNFPLQWQLLLTYALIQVRKWCVKSTAMLIQCRKSIQRLSSLLSRKSIAATSNRVLLYALYSILLLLLWLLLPFNSCTSPPKRFVQSSTYYYSISKCVRVCGCVLVISRDMSIDCHHATGTPAKLNQMEMSQLSSTNFMPPKVGGEHALTVPVTSEE